VSFDEVLDCEHIHTHALSLLKERFSEVCEISWNLAWLQSLSHAELMGKLLSLLLGPWQRMNIALSHVVNKLTRQFLKRFSRQKCWVVFELVEWHKLHNVC